MVGPEDIEKFISPYFQRLKFITKHVIELPGSYTGHRFPYFGYHLNHLFRLGLQDGFAP
jgi:hypothetical protein